MALWVLVSFLSSPVWADGLPDQGFDNGPPFVRTEYYFTDEGTSANPLTIDSCIFLPSSARECQNPPTVYQQSNFWSQNVACFPWSSCSHWTLVLNNEDAFKTLNPGPPDASLPRSLPGYGIFGFNTIYDNFPGNNVPGDNMWRAHEVLNLSSQFPNPTTNKLPYMAMGAWTGAGLATPVGVINPSNSSKLTTIEFGTRLWQWIPTTHWPDPGYENQPLVLGAYFVVFADWGSYPKAIQVNFFHWHLNFNGMWAWRDWNWPIEESAYYPGARFVYVSAEDLQSLCGLSVPRLQYPGADVDYSIDLNALFQCADQAGAFDEPLPQTANIPITSVSWATEGSGRDGALWIDVHDMRMVSDSQAQAVSPAQEVNDSNPGYSPITARIKQQWDALCSAAPGCPARAAAVQRRDPSVYQSSMTPEQQRQAIHGLLGWNFGLPNDPHGAGQ